MEDILSTTQAILQHPLVRGGLTGLGAAFVVDLAAFLRWNSPDEIKTFAVKLAILRYAQGLVGGALTAAGISIAS